MITIRVVTAFGGYVIVENDGVQVGYVIIDGPDSVMKAIEIALKTAGFVPDIDGMYMNDSLMVLHFNKENDNAKTEERS